jgi:hypothetical protein
LASEDGAKRVIQDNLGRVVHDVESIRTARPGRDLVLSVDLRIQYLAYRELKAAIREQRAKSGSVVVLDVTTGEVLAMVNQPTYNPNDRDQRKPAGYRNRAATDILEPGSSIKPFVVAAISSPRNIARLDAIRAAQVKLADPRLLSADKIEAEEPVINTTTARGGIEYRDAYLIDNDCRFVFSFVRSALEAEAYWRDVGTVDAYWESNIDLTDVTPALDLYDTDWPIWTYSELTAPAKFVHDEPDRRGQAISSLVSGGCIVSGTELRRSLLFTGVRTSSYSRIDEAVILPHVQVGRHVRLKKVVIDRGAVVPDGLVVGEDPVLDAQRFRRTERGVCLITQTMLDQLGR